MKKRNLIITGFVVYILLLPILKGCAPMNKQIRNDVEILFKDSKQNNSKTIIHSDIEHLPPLLQSYLIKVGVIGKAEIQSVRLKQTGSFRTKPEQKWMPLVAEQYYNPNSNGFVWLGKINAAPMISITGKDVFLDNKGRMVVKLLNLKTIGDAQGPEIDEGELMRYISEIPWFPTAFLNENLEWNQLDSSKVQVTIKLNDAELNGIFHFNDNGLLEKFTAQRYMDVDGKYILEEWAPEYLEYEHRNGYLIPSRGKAIWLLDSGAFCYFDGTVTDIEYNIPEIY